MSYDVAIWEGPRPRDDEAAAALFEELSDASDAAYDAGTLAPPTPAIRDLVTTLTARWTDRPSPDQLAVWSMSDPLEAAHGSFVYLCLTFDGADTAVPVIAREAATRSLVCFDPQREELLG